MVLPLVGLARSKQDAINRGHSAQYLKNILRTIDALLALFFPYD